MAKIFLLLVCILKFYIDIQFSIKSIGPKYQVIQFVIKHILYMASKWESWTLVFNPLKSLCYNFSNVRIWVLLSSGYPNHQG